MYVLYTSTFFRFEKNSSTFLIDKVFDQILKINIMKHIVSIPSRDKASSLPCCIVILMGFLIYFN